MSSEQTKADLEIQKLRLEVEALKKPKSSFRSLFIEQWQGTLVALVVTFLAIFPNTLIEKTKDALNRSDQRFAHMEDVSVDLSEYAFDSQLLVEFYQQGWTTTNSLTPIANDYNDSITRLMKREQLNRAIINRFWGGSYLDRFDLLMQSVKNFDAGIHELNPEANKLIMGKELYADPKVVAPIVARLKPEVEQLNRDINGFLSSLIQ